MAGLTFESALIVAILTVLFALLSVAVATRPAIAIPLLLLVVMLFSASLEPVSVVAGIHVGATEILSVTLVVATLIRLQSGLGWRPSRLLVLLMLVLVLSVVRGLTPFGLQSAVLSAEDMFAMLSTAVFFSTVRITPSLIRTLRNSFLLAFGVSYAPPPSFGLSTVSVPSPQRAIEPSMQSKRSLFSRRRSLWFCFHLSVD